MGPADLPSSYEDDGDGADEDDDNDDHGSGGAADTVADVNDGVDNNHGDGCDISLEFGWLCNYSCEICFVCRLSSHQHTRTR